MERQPQNSSLIQVALLGTESKQLDRTAFPQVLCPAIQQILQDAQDSEDAFFQIAALNFSYALSTEQVKLNSFSIEEMARYQQLQSDLKLQALESTTEQSEDAADPLLTKVQMHSGPLPLPFVNDNSHVFLPDAVGTLINRVVANYRNDGYRQLLYWTLQKLEHCHMVLPPQCIFPLAECVFADWWRNHHLFVKGGISFFMLFELMFKIGGPGLRCVMLHFAPKKFDSVFTQPEFVAHLDAHDGQVDYDYLLEHASESEVKGAFISLRWQDPTRARELVQKYWDNERFRGAFLEAMQINLSLADGPFLISILQTNSSHLRNVAATALRQMKDSNYAKQCAQQFLAHVQYLGPDNKKADKGGLKIECFTYSYELRALGISNPWELKPTRTGSKMMLIELLERMDLSDILALTGQANEPQVAIDIWGRHIIKSALFYQADIFVCEFLFDKICSAEDAVAVEAFLQQAELIDGLLFPDNCLADLFTPENREHYPLYLDMLWGNFLSPEIARREIDFNPLQDAWAKQLLDVMYKYRIDEWWAKGFMTWPYSMIEGLKQYVAEQRRQKQRKRAFEQLDWLEKMLAGLELKRQIDELLENSGLNGMNKYGLRLSAVRWSRILV